MDLYCLFRPSFFPFTDPVSYEISDYTVQLLDLIGAVWLEISSQSQVHLTVHYKFWLVAPEKNI